MRIKNICLILILSFSSIGCSEEKQPENGYEQALIVGSFLVNKTDKESGIGTGEIIRGYCILLFENKDSDLQYPLDYITFDLPSDLVDIPEELLSLDYDPDNCGPNFFPATYRFTYKIGLNYDVLNSKDETEFALGPCTASGLTFPWENYSQIKILNAHITTN